MYQHFVFGQILMMTKKKKQYESYKGFFMRKKKAKSCHIFKGEKLKSPCLDNKFQHVTKRSMLLHSSKLYKRIIQTTKSQQSHWPEKINLQAYTQPYSDEH